MPKLKAIRDFKLQQRMVLPSDEYKRLNASAVS